MQIGLEGYKEFLKGCGGKDEDEYEKKNVYQINNQYQEMGSIMSETSQVRSFLYNLARRLGWIQIVIDFFTGHTREAFKKLANKFIGRKIGSKIYFK